ncbi:MAG: phage holin family protein [Cyanobacteria bacterium P01_D01_bin.36]
MLGFVLTTFITALSLLVVDLTVPGVIIPTVGASLLAAVVLGLVNGSIKPLIQLFSLPITVLSLGSFSLIINGFCFWFASLFVPGFTIHGLLGFILGPIVLSAVSTFLTGYAMNKGWDKKLEGLTHKLNGTKNVLLQFANSQKLAGNKLPQ